MSYRALSLLMLLVLGCSGAPELAPVEGKISYKGQPLKFGTVMFQNVAGGQPASGSIQPDGSFKPMTPGAGDGVKPGQYKVSVHCYESQDPARQANASNGEQSLGKLLIPKQYTLANTSGLTVDVKPEGNDPIVLELTDK